VPPPPSPRLCPPQARMRKRETAPTNHRPRSTRRRMERTRQPHWSLSNRLPRCSVGRRPLALFRAKQRPTRSLRWVLRRCLVSQLLFWFAFVTIPAFARAATEADRQSVATHASTIIPVSNASPPPRALLRCVRTVARLSLSLIEAIAAEPGSLTPTSPVAALAAVCHALLHWALPLMPASTAAAELAVPLADGLLAATGCVAGDGQPRDTVIGTKLAMALSNGTEGLTLQGVGMMTCPHAFDPLLFWGVYFDCTWKWCR